MTPRRTEHRRAPRPGAGATSRSSRGGPTAPRRLGLDAPGRRLQRRSTPSYTFVNGAVAGGAGSAAKDLLQSRLQADDPPDTFQAHAGKELTDYIDAGQIEDVSALYDEFGVCATCSRPTCSTRSRSTARSTRSRPTSTAPTWCGQPDRADGGAGSTPRRRTQHRRVVRRRSTQVKAKGVDAALGRRRPGPRSTLLETVLISDLGADGYTGLWDGSDRLDRRRRHQRRSTTSRSSELHQQGP